METGIVDPLRAPGHLLRRAQQVHTEAWGRLVATVTGPQYAVLVTVAGWPGLDQRMVGALASLDKATTAGIVSRLADDGWLDRTRDPADRRRRIITLTEKADESLAALTARARTVQDELLSPVAPRARDPFIDVLGQVARVQESAIAEQYLDGRTLQLARTPGYLLRRAQQHHAALWAEVVADVTGPQYAVLVATVSGRTATHAQIGSRASLDSSSTREVVNRLIDRGWLEPIDNARDRRSRPVTLTAPAATAIRLLAEPVLEVQRRVLAPLKPDDRDRFIRWMRLVARVDKDSSTPTELTPSGLLTLDSGPP